LAGKKANAQRNLRNLSPVPVLSLVSSNQWFSIFANDRFEELFREVYRVLRRDRHFYLFCDPETMFVAKPVAESCGFKFWKPLVWDKINIGMGYHFRCRYEFVLFFEKGKRNLNDLSVPDILQAKMIKNGYPAEKPVDLLRILVRQSAVRGELVCDPFFGSGSTGLAAVEEECNFLGADISPEALKAASSRLLAAGAKEDDGLTIEGQLGLRL
jgi:site-specific DNA-methyltransferase (adenine-specific)